MNTSLRQSAYVQVPYHGVHVGTNEYCVVLSPVPWPCDRHYLDYYSMDVFTHVHRHVHGGGVRGHVQLPITRPQTHGHVHRRVRPDISKAIRLCPSQSMAVHFVRWRPWPMLRIILRPLQAHCCPCHFIDVRCRRKCPLMSIIVHAIAIIIHCCREVFVSVHNCPFMSINVHYVRCFHAYHRKAAILLCLFVTFVL